MSDFADQAQNKADELGGRAKDAVGNLTGDDSLQADGKVDQATANVKQAAGKAGDALGDIAGNTADAVTSGSGVVNRLSRLGMRSENAYAAAFASIGLSLTSWFVSRNKKGDSKAQSDRWGIFIGHWAPTFMALGVALKLEEK